jgi:hypothetical protein
LETDERPVLRDSVDDQVDRDFTARLGADAGVEVAEARSGVSRRFGVHSDELDGRLRLRNRSGSGSDERAEDENGNERG